MSQQVPGPAGPASLTAAELERLLLGCQEGLLDYVRGHLQKGLRGMHDPQDFVQAAFLEGFGSLTHFDPSGADAAIRWMTTIARHEITRLVKARSAAKRGGGRPAVASIPSRDDESSGPARARQAVDERTP